MPIYVIIAPLCINCSTNAPFYICNFAISFPQCAKLVHNWYNNSEGVIVLLNLGKKDREVPSE